MGVNINLYVSSNKIDPEKWKEVYEESVHLLNNHPDSPMGLKSEPTDYGIKKYILTRDVEVNKDNLNERHWRIVGDFKTHEKAGSFIVYYDFNRYMKNVTDELKSYDDILLGIDPYLSEETDIVTIFDNKTQGFLYHSIILAVASLFESRFPYNIIVSGNIDYLQAKKSVNKANDILDEPIEMPVVVQPDKLYNRLSKYYEKDELLEKIELLYRGDNFRLIKYFAKNVDKKVIYNRFIKDLNNYNSPGQVGAKKLFDEWLICTNDFNTLCKMACVDKKGPKFDPVEFCKSLISMWITIKESEKDEYLYIFKKPEGITDTISSFLIQTMLMMHMGHKTNIYINKDQLIHIVGELFPNKINQIKRAIDKAEKGANKEFSDFKDKIDKFVKKVSKIKEEDDKLQCSEIQKDYPYLYFDSPDKITKNNYDYIKQIASGLPPLMKRIKNDKDWNEPFAEGFKDIDLIKKYIIILIDKQGMALTEEAWKRLENETNHKILTILFLLSMIDDDELEFSRFRCNVFENRELCKEIVKLTEQMLF